MRIGINTLFLIPDEVGGSETYFCETLKALLAIGGGHEFVLFTSREGHGKLFPMFGKEAGVFFQSLEFSAANRYSRILREQTQLSLAARRWKLDVLWSPGYTAPLFAPCPQAVTIHDVQYKRHPEDLSPLARITSDFLIRSAAKRCERILAVSQFTQSEIEHFYGTSPKKISVILEAADAQFAQRQPDSVFDKLASEHNLRRPYVLCVSNTYPHKNLHALAKAFAELQRAIPHQLVLVSKPRLGEPLLQEALAACDPARVCRLSGLSRPELISLYQRAGLFVFPSLYEGFGLPVLEAMLAGTPVLTTRCASIPEVGSDTVDYFDPEMPGDLAARLSVLLAGTENKTARAQARAMTFTWAETAELTLAALQSAAARGR